MAVLEVYVGPELKRELEEVVEKRVGGFSDISEVVNAALKKFLE